VSGELLYLDRKSADALGMIAGALTTLSFVPQVVSTYRCRSGKGLSWGMLLAFTTGVVLWFFYGIVLQALPVILTNAVAFALLVAIIVMKVLYK
jgi:MtN3 and saliva related transmembrane protein